ncbi:MAG: hypothetical protein P1U89_13340 [Verrucomicrobiales bacterium]|nr:hypothetical protein [Verrucomicrobiales bacterium]
MQSAGNSIAHHRSVLSTPLPSVYYAAHNGVVLIQALLVLLAPWVSYLSGEPTIMDRMVDLTFAGYLALIAVRCIFDKPTFRLMAGLALIGAYGGAGLIEAITANNLGGFVYEAKLLVSAALFFCLLDKRPTVSDLTVKILFFSFIIASCIFLVLFRGERLHIVNESNYLCLYIGITMFSYLSAKGRAVGLRTIVGLGIFTLFLIVATQSRTGAGFMLLIWLVYIWERFGFRTAFLGGIAMSVIVTIAGITAIALDAPIVKRFEELKNPGKVDRFIFFEQAVKIVQRRPIQENLMRFSYADPVSTRVPNDMKWLTSHSEHGTEIGQLYPHHFHLAFLRILVGHGFIPFFLYLAVIVLLWKVNKYLSLGIAICSLSMSVPYLSLFFGTLQLALAFTPNRRSTN